MKTGIRLKSLLIATAILVGHTANAHEDRALFSTAFNSVSDKETVFCPGGGWVPYPAYEDRAAWDALTEGYKETIISGGERFLNLKWMPMPASVYLEYEKTQDRSILTKYDHQYREALSDMILAELAEGKGRFIPQIINGLFYSVERTSWSHAQHNRMQTSGRTLPVPGEKVVSLNSAVYAANVAIAWHFFHKSFDKIDPSISKTILWALEENCFKPYMERDWSWMGFERKNGKSVNNWNCFCNYYCTLAFLMADQNKDRLLKALARSTYSFDQYMDYIGRDGACEEGSFYWTMASAKVYEYARLLCDASSGRLDVLKDRQIRDMGTYMVNSHIGDGWVLDVSDSDPRLGPDIMYRDVFFKYGYDTGCKSLENLAIALMADTAAGKFRPCEVRSLDTAREMYRAMETLRYNARLKEAQQAALNAAGGDWELMVRNLSSDVKSHWYEETQIATLRNGAGWFIGAKAGHNAESHGHMDVGSSVVFHGRFPILIDPGVETYQKSTFGAMRSRQWWSRTEWHNLPVIGGCGQMGGRNAKASAVKCSTAAGTMSCDIAGAYPAEASVSRWERSYSLLTDGVTIRDNYALKTRRTADEIHFITPGQVVLPGGDADGYKVKSGELVIISESYDGGSREKFLMTYPAALKPAVEKKEMTDPRFIASWKKALYRITLTSDSVTGIANTYMYNISIIK